MGTWGTGISSNDIYEDIYYHFFDLYDQGMEISDITEKLIKENSKLINSHEDQNNFWITIAKSQWECKALDKEIYNRIKDIVTSEKDLELWKELGARTSEITKRKKVLHTFLNKITKEKKTARKRKKEKLRAPIFEKGDCLIFKLNDGDYCGVFVLEAEKETEFGMNLIAVTDIKKTEKPSVKDFENAKVLFDLQQFGKNYFRPEEKVNWYYAQHYKKAEIKLEKVGQLEVELNYQSSKDFETFSNWDNLKLEQDHYYSQSPTKRVNKSIKLKKLRKPNWFQKL